MWGGINLLPLTAGEDMAKIMYSVMSESVKLCNQKGYN
jgi:hypothetical protein